MPIAETIIGVGYVIAEQQAPDPQNPGQTIIAGRVLVFKDDQFGRQWQFPLDDFAADDIAGQLRGEPAKKRVEIAVPGMPQQMFQSMPNGRNTG
jgi:hypothetical protein